VEGVTFKVNAAGGAGGGGGEQEEEEAWCEQHSKRDGRCARPHNALPGTEELSEHIGHARVGHTKQETRRRSVYWRTPVRKRRYSRAHGQVDRSPRHEEHAPSLPGVQAPAARFAAVACFTVHGLCAPRLRCSARLILIVRGSKFASVCLVSRFPVQG
jgi:hypothetical protein